MQGRLIFINQPKGQSDGAGLIFGADRNRYRFELATWRGGPLPPRNTMLEFDAAGDTALNVHVVGEDDDFTPVSGPILAAAPPKPAKAKGKIASPAKAAALTPEASEEAETIELAAPIPAATATQAPNLSAAPTARLLLTEMPAPRFPLKAFLIGLLIMVLLVGIAMAVTFFRHS